jgi:hypothetical protein
VGDEHHLKVFAYGGRRQRPGSPSTIRKGWRHEYPSCHMVTTAGSIASACDGAFPKTFDDWN